jgi:hypothetical protein
MSGNLLLDLSDISLETVPIIARLLLIRSICCCGQAKLSIYFHTQSSSIKFEDESAAGWRYLQPDKEKDTRSQ